MSSTNVVTPLLSVSLSLLMTVVIAAVVYYLFFSQTSPASDEYPTDAEEWTYEEDGSEQLPSGEIDIVPTTYAAFTLSPASTPNKCIDASDASGKKLRNDDLNGTPIQVWDCVPDNKNQQFELNADGQLKWGDKCVDPVQLAERDGTKIQLWTCNDGNKGWQLFDDGTMRWKEHWCLNVPSGANTNSTQLELKHCDSAKFIGTPLTT